MTINDWLLRKRGAAHGLMLQALRVQRLWIDGRDRWVSLPRRLAEQELQERFGDWRAAVALMRFGREIHTPSARYRAIAVPQTDSDLL
jgi:hypothetical protein